MEGRFNAFVEASAMPAYPLLDAQLGQKAKTRQKFNQKIREIDWLHLCP